MTGLHPDATGAELIADLVALGGAGMALVEFGAPEPAGPKGPGVVTIGVHRGGVRPSGGLEAFDILLSADETAPRPWVALPGGQLDAALASIRTQIERQPAAATVAAQVMRMSLGLDFGAALVLESLGYSALLASDGFRAWRTANPPRMRAEDDTPRVLQKRKGGSLHIRLNRSAARNAFDARMRDALVEALEIAVLDPDVAQIALSGEGPVFCAGGDLDEFGTAPDVGRAHLIRVLRSPCRLVHALAPRVTAHLHGACIGAGIEIPAAAGRVDARAGTIFRLPEVSMGLIPGAGGTVSIPRRIGRQRACYMAISGADIDVKTALAWGLIDEAVP
jgi:hypothetical protein